MTTLDDENDTSVSLTLARASHYPIMRRVDQHFELETKFKDYENSLSRVNGKNSLALASLGYQEQRLREMQASLKASMSSVPSAPPCRTVQRSANQEILSIAPNTLDTGQAMLPIQNTRSAKTTGNNTKQSATIKEPNGRIYTMDSASSIPEAPNNFQITEISHDSFTAQWDTDDEGALVDHEIKFICTSAEGRDTEIRQNCSMWCLKDPVAKGRFVVCNLEPNTQYRDVAIRCRNRIGWSKFGPPIHCITTPPKGENIDLV